MDIKRVISEIEYNNGVFPENQIKYLINNKEEAIPGLLGIIEDTYKNSEEVSKKGRYFAHIHGAYLLAQFKEYKGYELLYKIVSIEGDIPYDLFGDTITETLDRILASVCCGDISLIKKIIENRNIDEYTRNAALRALVVLVARKKKSREDILEYFGELYAGKLEREFSYVWNSLVHCTYKLQPKDLMDEITKVYDEDLMDGFGIELEEVEKQSKLEIDDVLRKLDTDHRMMFIEDTISELKNWACFRQEKPK